MTSRNLILFLVLLAFAVLCGVVCRAADLIEADYGLSTSDNGTNGSYRAYALDNNLRNVYLGYAVSGATNITFDATNLTGNANIPAPCLIELNFTVGTNASAFISVPFDLNSLPPNPPGAPITFRRHH